MESVVAVRPPAQASFSFAKLSYKDASSRTDLFVLEASLRTSRGGSSDVVGTDFKDLYKALSVTAREVVDKINELLKGSLPEGVQSLSPEEVTPEASAEKIVQGATAFFDVFAKQNPELEGEELLNKFLETIKGGIEAGYSDAYSTLEGLGAFEFEGVKEGVEKTKSLIAEKLAAWEAFKRKDLGIDEEVAEDVKTEVTSTILSQAGVSVAA